MKKHFFLLPVIFFLSTLFFAFTDKKGGDVFQLFLNEKQVHQQFVRADNSVKKLHLSSVNGNDNIGVMYSHCGYAGKGRVITLRNEKEEVIRTLKFPDVANNQARMNFSIKELMKFKSNTMRLYYSSKELSTAKLLATISWRNEQSVAKN